LKSLSELNHLSEYIAESQDEWGGIPSEREKILDPWDHIECCMALDVFGEKEKSSLGFQWLIDNQEDDGSWYSEYQANKNISSRKESNFSSYIAIGALHNYESYGDLKFLENLLPTLKKSLEFTLSAQTDFGEFSWAMENGKWLDDALKTGNSSIYMSLKAYKKIFDLLGQNSNQIESSLTDLKKVFLNNKPRFDRNWDSKERYSMDWYYPILAGIYDKSEAIRKINSKWNIFINEEFGCRCVSDRPWITVAETSELIITLNKIDEIKKAKDLFEKVSKLKDPKDNIFWMGYVFDDEKYWPIEKPTWTAAAYILAANALNGFTSAGDFFKKL
jgi:hypothetical protein